MLNFIELHRTGGIHGGDPYSVNLEQVISYSDHLVITTRTEDRVKETAEEITQLVTDAGSNFVKRDPRISNEPITWEELKTMTGEPVWGENQQRWFLVVGSDSGEREIDLADRSSFWSFACTQYTEAELIRKPLYRMRK